MSNGTSAVPSNTTPRVDMWKVFKQDLSKSCTSIKDHPHSGKIAIAILVILALGGLSTYGELEHHCWSKAWEQDIQPFLSQEWVGYTAEAIATLTILGFMGFCAYEAIKDKTAISNTSKILDVEQGDKPKGDIRKSRLKPAHPPPPPPRKKDSASTVTSLPSGPPPPTSGIRSSPHLSILLDGAGDDNAPL